MRNRRLPLVCSVQQSRAGAVKGSAELLCGMRLKARHLTTTPLFPGCSAIAPFCFFGLQLAFYVENLRQKRTLRVPKQRKGGLDPTPPCTMKSPKNPRGDMEQSSTALCVGVPNSRWLSRHLVGLLQHRSKISTKIIFTPTCPHNAGAGEGARPPACRTGRLSLLVRILTMDKVPHPLP